VRRVRKGRRLPNNSTLVFLLHVKSVTENKFSQILVCFSGPAPLSSVSTDVKERWNIPNQNSKVDLVMWMPQ
jgi:hypothetical protein